jgi:hypothetical protein
VRFESTSFRDGDVIDTRFTCDGAETSPDLRWDDLPDGTADLAVTCEDPDAPNGTFVHWVVWNVDPGAGGIPEGGPTLGAEGTNGFGRAGWGGPCPPHGHGAHRYFFTLYALGERVDLAPGSSVTDLRVAMSGKVLAERTIMGRYERT